MSSSSRYTLLFALLLTTTTITTANAQTNNLPTVTFHPDAKKYNCPSPLTSTTTPQRLDELSLDRGENIIHYILLEPHLFQRQLCTLTRVNNAFKDRITYIPLARSYDDNPLWIKSGGRYQSTTQIICGISDAAGPEGSGYQAGETLCQITLDPPLESGHDGYYLTTYSVQGEKYAENEAIASSFLERVTFGPTTDEIWGLGRWYSQEGPYALASWLRRSLDYPITSHRAEFRKRLHPRTVESYLYGIPGPRPCERNARYRRFAFTHMDVELSRGHNANRNGSTGAPYTRMKIETVDIGGTPYYVVKFGDHIRTILSEQLQYYELGDKYGPSGNLVSLEDGEYTLCNTEEFVGNQVGGISIENAGNYAFQILVGEQCSSSFTNRGGVDDEKGDGTLDTEVRRVAGQLVRTYDSTQCKLKCGSPSYLRYVKGGNPEVKIPAGFDTSTISYLDLSGLSTSQLVNLNPEKYHDSTWRLNTNLGASYTADPPTCTDANGDTIPDAAGLSYLDYFSDGRGKYNLDAPIFAKMPNGKWALHDYRTKLQGNTLENPLVDAGGSEVKRARRDVDGVAYGVGKVDGEPNVDLVTRCSNVELNSFNEAYCKISYDENACETKPAQNVHMENPSRDVEYADKYLPNYAGSAGVVVCGSENEVEPDHDEEDHYAISNRKLESHRIGYGGQIRTVWLEQALGAQDQPCQKLAWHLSKIFAYANGHGGEEPFINTYDWGFVSTCALTYADVVNRMTHSVQMGEQLTFIRNKSAAYEWHRFNRKNFPDENYARENLQLHQIGLLKLNEDGSPILDRFGKEVSNYEQKHIFSASKIFTGLNRSLRRGNYGDLDWSTTSYLDPLIQKGVQEKDWFPKIGMDDSYIGDKYPLCSDLPQRDFLKTGAKYVALGGNNLGRYHYEPTGNYLDAEVQKLQLNHDSSLFAKLCDQKGDFQFPTSSLAQGTGLAEFDGSIGAPKCSGTVASCSSADLLIGRYTFEPNSSSTSTNTIDDCVDGIGQPLRDGDDPNDSALISESVEQIVVTAVSGSNIRGGSWVNIEAEVKAYATNDRVDYYYASDASNPVWQFITTAAPTEGRQFVTLPRSNREKITFQLPNCDAEDHCDVAFRVALRSSRQVHPNNSAIWRSAAQSNDGQHKPDLTCAKDPYDDTDDLVVQVLPSPKPQDMCDFKTIVTLDEDLSHCDQTGNLHKECYVDTIRVLEVLPGVFYEYVRPPCVHMPFIKKSESRKVFAAWEMSTAMCADKRVPSASSSCCGGYSDRHPSSATWVDMLSEYRNERLTYEGNKERCENWDRTTCSDPARIGPFRQHTGHCLHHMSCKDVNSGGHGNVIQHAYYHWTDRSCEIKAKVDIEGMVAIIHKPDETGNPRWNKNFPSPVLPLVDFDSTVSFFSVHWDKTGVAAGKLEYPHVTDNECSGGEIYDDYCLCGTTVQEDIVFSSIPTKAQVLDELHIGAFAPDTSYQILESSTDVVVYSKGTSYALDTIFKVTNVYNGKPLYLKNMKSVVDVCDGTFKFRNAPSFYNLANADLVSAKQEMDAYLESVLNNNSAPPFTCKLLLKHFGFSNPSADHVLRCSQAFKSGQFIFSDPENNSPDIVFGSGNRSDMHAILASIVLSPESYSPSVIIDPANGGVQDPFEKLLHVMRSMELEISLHSRRTDGLMPNVAGALGSGCHGLPDQFSFYSPDFIPPKHMLEAGLTSPQGQLANLNRIVSLSNALFSISRFGFSGCGKGIGPRWDRGIYATCGNNGDGLYNNTAAYLTYTHDDEVTAVDDLALLLTSGRLSGENKEIIKAHFDLIYDSNDDEATMREALQVASILIMSTPEFHTWNTIATSNTARTATPTKPKNDNVTYKAIVHVNLFGGMDSMSMLAPHPDGCQSLYNEYKSRRGNDNYVAASSMVKIDATSSEQPCTHFGVHNSLNNLAQIYDEGDAIFFANIGHLQKPVDRYNFLLETDAQLFGHHSMQDEMMKVDAFGARSGTGVMGRMADIFSATSISIGQTSVIKSRTILKGDPSLANPITVVKTGGLDKFYDGRDICKSPGSGHGVTCTPGSEHSKRSPLVEKIHDLNKNTKATSSLQAEFWSQAFIDAMIGTDSSRTILDNACKSLDLDGGGSYVTISCSVHSDCPHGCKCSSNSCKGGGPFSPPQNENNKLAEQLDIVYRLIAINEARGVNRDFFAVELGGFDTHFELLTGLSGKFNVINSALNGFRDNLKANVLSDGTTTLWDQVTLVMSSEFGRTVSPNSSAGTDHGWGGNSFMMGGKVNGKQILGNHPSTYDPADDYNTGRNVWIPQTPWEAKWYAIVQWAGITDDTLIEYILPNAANFGCNLYAEADLYENGAATISGCGGIAIDLEQSFFVSEPRTLTPEEQIAFCGKVKDSISSINIRCVILKQILTEIAGDGRMLTDGYELIVNYEITTDSTENSVESTITTTVNSEEFKNDAANTVNMETEIQSAIVVTTSPSESPSYSPTEPVNICTIVTETIFDNLFPASERNQVYSYEGFCTAVDVWNTNNPEKNIFVSKQQVDLNEIAAFFGHVLHESDSLKANREYSQCRDPITNDSGDVLCKPDGYSGSVDYTDPYCSTAHTSSSDPDGCDCTGTVSASPYNSDYVKANDLYFGRGPLQISHNYNYIDAGAAIPEDQLCAEPDLIATDETKGWASAFWFWTTSTGSTGKTCAQYVNEGSFGGTLNTINGGFECPQSGSYTGEYEASVVSRLNKYCKAATAFSVEGLLPMTNCDTLQDTFDSCVTATSPSPSCGDCQVWQGITFQPSPKPSISMKPSGEPSLNPSLSAMPSGQPSLSSRPSVAVNLDSYYGHSFVGYGSCEGKVNVIYSFYDYVQKEDGSYVSASKCPEACAQYRTNNNYQGFEFEPQKCRCLFNDGTNIDSIVNEQTHTARGAILQSASEVVSDVRCYKKDNIDERDAPEDVDKFKYIGLGDCWDELNQSYSYIPQTLLSATPAIRDCGDACSLTNHPLSKGFFVNLDTADNICNCLFDSDYVDDDLTVGNGGTGEITTSNYVGGHCYRALPAPTNFPTKMPTPPPTPRPTIKITSSPSDSPSFLPSLNPSLTPSVSLQPSAESSSTPSESLSPTTDTSSSPSVSAYPSFSPSMSPSESTFPSEEPSGETTKSRSPSSVPSSIPSLNPSMKPSESFSPSITPSLGPSESLQPSSSPSSIPSLNPSMKPSESFSPSISPSLGPSESVQPSSSPSSMPSSMPSFNPSVSFSPTIPMTSSPSESTPPSSTPSLMPSVSFHPSLSPSLSPSESSAPSDGPSFTPSMVPSISTEPSNGDTDSPTDNPTTSRPTVTPFLFEFKFSSSLTLQTGNLEVRQILLPGNGGAGDDFLAVMTEEIKRRVCRDDATSCVVTITKFNGNSVEDGDSIGVINRRLRSQRSLQTNTSTLLIEFEVVLEAICDTDCSNAELVGNLLYTQATGELEDAFEDGTFINAVIADLSAYSDVQAILASANVSWTFEDVIIPILQYASEWYPDWDSGEKRCKNDGEAPDYMSIGGSWWLTNSRESCCKKYFSWAYDECAGESAVAPTGFYPLWGGVEPKCESGDPPNYMRRNSAVWIVDTIEACCNKYFAWSPDCVTNSGGNSGPDLTADLYYADWENSNTCISDGNAPGYMKSNPNVWMFDTLLDCCKTNYFWGEQYTKCLTSEGADAPTSSPIGESWYIDWSQQLCVKSCVGPSPCGGMHESWKVLYSTAAKCCKAHLWWKSDCTRNSLS